MLLKELIRGYRGVPAVCGDGSRRAVAALLKRRAVDSAIFYSLEYFFIRGAWPFAQKGSFSLHLAVHLPLH